MNVIDILMCTGIMVAIAYYGSTLGLNRNANDRRVIINIMASVLALGVCLTATLAIISLFVNAALGTL